MHLLCFDYCIGSFEFEKNVFKCDICFTNKISREMVRIEKAIGIDTVLHHIFLNCSMLSLFSQFYQENLINPFHYLNELTKMPSF